MSLHVEVRGSGPPLALLHGFTQTGRLWGRFGELLAGSHTLIAIDLPGHGGSDAVRANLPMTAGLVADAVSETLGDRYHPCDLLGYSLGARVALHVVTNRTLALRSVVLIGGTAGMDDPDERARRRRSDEFSADELEASGDVGRFLRDWVRGPLFARLRTSGTTDLQERLRNSAPGLASSLRLTGTGTQEPLWDRLHAHASPVLVLAGTDDTRFAAHARRLARSFPSGIMSLVPGGGHAVHLAQPDATARLVDHWLGSLGPPS